MASVYKGRHISNGVISLICISFSQNKKVRQKTAAAFYVALSDAYSSEIAPTGQFPAQDPQEMHASASILYWLSP